MILNLTSSGNKAAVDKYSKELGRPASESTVCGLKKVYYLTVQYNAAGAWSARTASTEILTGFM